MPPLQSDEFLIFIAHVWPSRRAIGVWLVGFMKLIPVGYGDLLDDSIC